MKRFFLSLLFLLPGITSAQDRPLPAMEAPKRMTLPEGFQATLFAGEPDVVQPIAMTFDDRGRLWVVECLSYPKWTDKPEGTDRVLMFEDTDGDGKFDKRTVIFDKGANLSGIELGFGGIWLCSIPNLLFIPCDFNADAPKIGKPEAVLDGWSLKCKHNVFNSLTWGPDGWLYGCNGIIDMSRVGKPGTPDKDRIAMNCGVWRYHPTKKIFEPFAHGTTNPFGLDFDEYGECFITNCVIAHIWHVIPGAHFERMYGEDLNKYIYQPMKSCADHLHWGGGPWTSSRGGKGVHSEAGGGHAHVGCMIYLGDNWPDKYRNGAFMLNLHGSRVNHDRLERQGSGYVAKHEKDFLLANDPWFRGIAIKYGPDGGVYMSDWTDTGECHNYDKVDLTNGRIYKVTHGKPKPWAGDLSKMSDVDLVKLQTHKNEWQVRHARRLLQERAVAKTFSVPEIKTIRTAINKSEDPVHLLRYLWTLYAVDPAVSQMLPGMMIERSDVVRAWAFRLYLELEGGSISDAFANKVGSEFESMSPVVRRTVASSLQRLKPQQRTEFLVKLLHHGEDAGDANLPLMLWYAAEPLAEADPAAAMRLARESKIPLVRRFMARRLVELADKQSERWTSLLDSMREGTADADRIDLMRGMEDGLSGRRQVNTPAGWSAVYAQLQKSPSEDVRKSAMKLAVVFGDKDAIQGMKQIVEDAKGETANRKIALDALVFRNNPEIVPLLKELLLDKDFRGPAVRALAGFNISDTPELILKHYPQFTAIEKADAVQTLASRSAWALKLLDAIEAKQIPRTDVSVFTARQIQGLKEKAVQDRLAKVWGQIKPASAEKVEQTAKLKKILTPEFLKAADHSKGRAVYAKNCAACHRLYDDGGDIGPALTGAQRHNLDYVLENVLDPSAVVAKEYQMVKIDTASGRTINGIVKQETEKAITIQTPNEVIVLPKDEIESRKQSPLSMMPEGLFDKLSSEDIRDLVAYLAGKDQVPLPKEK